MRQLRLKWEGKGFGNYHGVRTILILDGEWYPLSYIRGNKWTLLWEMLKGLKYRLRNPYEIETEIEDNLAEIIEILFSLRGRFPKKYIKLKDNPKELLEELKAFRISNEMK